MFPDRHGRSCLVLHAVVEALQVLVLRPEVDLRFKLRLDRAGLASCMEGPQMQNWEARQESKTR
jgi:hypothetical protein